MKPNQRFAIVASTLSGIVFAGTTLAFVSTKTHAPSDVLRPTILAEPGMTGGARLAPHRRSLRFVYVPPKIGILTRPPVGTALTWMPVVAAAETWAVNVRAEPDTAKREARRSKTRPQEHRYTLRKRLAQISPRATPRLAKKFKAATAPWPPAEIALVVIKDEKALDLYARAGKADWTFVHRYPVLAASGLSGPKLRRGDRQVPEGVYRISYLNPNSRYHVSLRVNYPNGFDRRMATIDGRTDLGGDIMIHGSKSSAGCLAMGDQAAEELFVLVAKVGKSNARVVIAPTDLRRSVSVSPPNAPKWLPELYTNLTSVMTAFPAPPKPSLLSLLGF